MQHIPDLSMARVQDMETFYNVFDVCLLQISERCEVFGAGCRGGVWCWV